MVGCTGPVFPFGRRDLQNAIAPARHIHPLRREEPLSGSSVLRFPTCFHPLRRKEPLSGLSVLRFPPCFYFHPRAAGKLSPVCGAADRFLPGALLWRVVVITPVPRPAPRSPSPRFFRAVAAPLILDASAFLSCLAFVDEKKCGAVLLLTWPTVGKSKKNDDMKTYCTKNTFCLRGRLPRQGPAKRTARRRDHRHQHLQHGPPSIDHHPVRARSVSGAFFLLSCVVVVSMGQSGHCFWAPVLAWEKECTSQIAR